MEQYRVETLDYRDRDHSHHHHIVIIVISSMSTIWLLVYPVHSVL